MRRANGNSFRPPLTVTLVHDVYKPSLAFRDILMLSFCHRVPFFFFFFFRKAHFRIVGMESPEFILRLTAFLFFLTKTPHRAMTLPVLQRLWPFKEGMNINILALFNRGSMRSSLTACGLIRVFSCVRRELKIVLPDY